MAITKVPTMRHGLRLKDNTARLGHYNMDYESVRTYIDHSALSVLYTNTHEIDMQATGKKSHITTIITKKRYGKKK